MKKLFPEMRSHPGAGVVCCIFVYWALCFVLFPFLIPVIGVGLWEELAVTAWLDTIYYAVNGVFLMMVMMELLKDGCLDISIAPKPFAVTTAVAAGLMLLWVAVCAWIHDVWMDAPGMVLDIFPITEMAVAQTPGLMVSNNPVFGTACVTLLTPFAVCGLFYVSTFAPICRNRPWLAYFVTAWILLLPVLFDIFWRDGGAFQLNVYFMRLPVHMLACWSYQKSDVVWTPVLSLGVLNLVCSVTAVICA